MAETWRTPITTEEWERMKAKWGDPLKPRPMSERELALAEAFLAEPDDRRG